MSFSGQLTPPPVMKPLSGIIIAIDLNTLSLVSCFESSPKPLKA